MNNPQRYMLDTNAASALIRGQIDATAQQTLLQRNLCISVITEAELRFGITRKPNATRLAQTVTAFLRTIPCLPWDSATAQTYAELRTRLEIHGIGLSAMDLLIAAHAVSENCILVSADRAFAQIPNLQLFDWSKKYCYQNGNAGP